MSFRKIAGYIVVVVVAIGLSGCGTKTLNTTVEKPARVAKVDSISVGSFGNSGFESTLKAKLSNSSALTINDRDNIVLTGSIAGGKIKSDRYSKSYKTKKGTSYTYYVKKQTSVEVRYELTDKRSGKVLGARNHGRSYDDYFSGDSYGEAEAKFPTDGQILGSLLDTLAFEVARDVSPQKVVVSLALMEGGCGLDLGIKYAQNKRLDQAMGIWQQTTTNQKCDNEEKMAGYHNIGVLYEARGEYEEAFTNIAKANSMDPENEDVIKALTRIEDAWKEKQKLEKQR